jgi:DNA invertase Pin-like site-specific DNA recombinase
MGKRLPDEVIQRICLRIEAHEPPVAIAKAVGVANQTVYRIIDNLIIWGTPYAPPTVHLGRPRTLTAAQELVMYGIMMLSLLLTLA